MGDKDLADVLRALTHLSEAVKEISQHMRPEAAQAVLRAQQGAAACLRSIALRHGDQGVSFSEADDQGVMFTMDFPGLGDPDGTQDTAVSLTNPVPPAPPRPPGSK